MKTVILALFVALVVSQSEALECYCGGQRHCSRRVETCRGLNPICGSVIFLNTYRATYSKGCMTSYQCELLDRFAIVACCSTDRCNR